jgi:hypothetical protein
MRVLVYGMQSSGSTAFTLFLAQRPDCLALVDVPNNFAAPRIDTALDMVTKVVVTTAYPLAVHLERFRPDRVVMLLRDPRDNYASLRTKGYRNYSGLIDEKFLILDQMFAERERFDAVIEYEDFVARDPAVLEKIRDLGWPVEDDFYNYRRRHNEMLEALWRHVPDLMPDFEFVFGNVRGAEVSNRFVGRPPDEELDAKLEKLCPRLLAHYRARR